MLLALQILGMLWMSLAPAAAAQQDAGPVQQAIVPAFFPVAQKTDPDAGYDWTRIEQAGSAVFAVVAESSFPFLSDDCAADAGVPTDCHAPGVIGLCQAKCQFTRNRSAGQKVFGYVMTGSGTRDYPYALADGGVVQNCPGTGDAGTDHRCVLYGNDAVLPDAGGYEDSSDKREPWVQKWYDAFCPDQSHCYIDGIFFDVGPSSSSVPRVDDLTQQTDYQQLFNEFKTTHSSFGMCSDSAYQNRQCLMVNASQYTGTWASSVADYLILWERALHGADNQPPDRAGNVQDYVTAFTPNPVPAWWLSSANAAEHVIAVATQNDVGAIIQASRDTTPLGNRGAPTFLYIHDRFKYGSLSCFFEQEIKALQNQPPVPGKTWCDATQSCLDISVTPCPTDTPYIIMVTDPTTGTKIPVVISL